MYFRLDSFEAKCYQCLFTFLSVRAVHTEVSLFVSTDVLIQELTRFLAKRGQPKIMSNNDSNFKGICKELRARILESLLPQIQVFIETRDKVNFRPCGSKPWWWCLGKNDSICSNDSVCRHPCSLTNRRKFVEHFGRVQKDIKWLSAVTSVSDALGPMTTNKLLLLKTNWTNMDLLEFPQLCLRFCRKS